MLVTGELLADEVGGGAEKQKSAGNSTVSQPFLISFDKSSHRFR